VREEKVWRDEDKWQRQWDLGSGGEGRKERITRHLPNTTKSGFGLGDG
jgi:hypothetical protein